jgi:hypothetical protein
MEEILERQGRMEREEVNKLKRSREEMMHVERFVCGGSFEEAEASCRGGGEGSSSTSSTEEGGTSTTTSSSVVGAHYCPSGSSSECPTNMNCYAAVSCPRSSHHEEVDKPPLNGAYSSFNSSLGGIANGEDYTLLAEEWKSFFRESSTMLSEAVGRLFGSSPSSHHGLLN